MAKRKTAGGGWSETIKTVVYAALIAILIRTLAFEPFNIPSGSMLPNLLVGDFLFVSKYSYGYSRHSLPFSPALWSGRLFFRQPQRGDVAVFKLPRDNATDYIKRIVGLEGDRIQVLNGVLHLNGQAVARVLVDEFMAEDDGPRERLRRYLEVLPGGRQHYIAERSDTDRYDNTIEYRVPPGHVFVMGDNRDNSLDSRELSAVGFVPLENLVGRAEFLFFSLEGPFWEVWNWRFSRFFMAVR
ncbi:MAG: signal peptidase I [Alphaproteobacteria bacterium]|nr:signal peptidase I [Alphaproteobacteria bacterium]